MQWLCPVALPGDPIQLCLLLLHGAALLANGCHDTAVPLREPEALQHEMVLLLCILPANWLLDYHLAIVSINTMGYSSCTSARVDLLRRRRGPLYY